MKKLFINNVLIKFAPDKIFRFWNGVVHYLNLSLIRCKWPSSLMRYRLLQLYLAATGMSAVAVDAVVVVVVEKSYQFHRNPRKRLMMAAHDLATHMQYPENTKIISQFAIINELEPKIS